MTKTRMRQGIAKARLQERQRVERERRKGPDKSGHPYGQVQTVSGQVQTPRKVAT